MTQPTRRIAHESRVSSSYLAVRHLSDADAARQLGRDRTAVRQYRLNHPEAAYDPASRNAVHRPGTIAYMVPVTEPNKSSNGAPTRWAAVTLPAPPPGPHCQPFERQGVRG